VTHETDVRHLRDPAFLKGALRYRVARLLFTLQMRLRSKRVKLGDFYAWNACLSHILSLAQVRQTLPRLRFGLA
jgi:acyl-CoA oxidase